MRGAEHPAGQSSRDGYLVRLIANPGREIDVLALVAVGTTANEPAEPILDDDALRQYRHRANELRARLAAGNASRREEERCRTELQALTDALRSATGLRGRSRNFVDQHERARTAVRKVLIRAIDIVASIERGLGEDLVTSISTGASCRCTPNPEWSVSVAGDR